MTRDDMLTEIEVLRESGHKISITGKGNQWECDLDGTAYKGGTPMAAFELARDSVGKDQV